ncbi:hypothetical protein H3C67_01190 [Candidatus Dojkabacteria bacterium]|uniref:Phosphoenolpyruvate synthase n=1 Tax=Candidatus Dojkabacteria bacterium TaxID=2099670 RepID=A0A952AH94_9BACT|nr:hypothetical protein [Candidatus Dojkabacteria bacterium]
MSEPKRYVVSTTQVNEATGPFVGDRANLLAEIEKVGVPIPTSFVVTNQAFDDFIVGADLVPFISERINNIDYTNKKKVKQSSKEIQEAIINARIPDIVSLPIEKAYSGLGGMLEAFVELRTSPARPELNEVNFSEGYLVENIKGVEMLLSALKELWAALFSEEALLFRASIAYEGPLTQAVLIQKHIQAEVSGIVYTQNKTSGMDTEMEIQAIMGLQSGIERLSLVPDSYFYNPSTEEIVNKKLVPQERMLVRRGRVDHSDPVTEVAISPSWRKKQKLEDRFIINLGRVGSSLRNLYASNLEIEYAFEAGRFYIINIVTEEETLLKRSALEISKDKARPIEELYPEMQELSGGPKVALARAEGGHIAEEEERDLSGLAVVSGDDDEEEAENIIARPESKEEERKEGVQIARTKARDKKKEDKIEIARNSAIPFDDRNKPEIKISGGIMQEPPINQPGVEVHGREVVVDIKPITSLEKIVSGIGFGKSAQFGLIHFVEKKEDWDGLTGDEIIVLKEFDPNKVDDINKARGLLLEKSPREEFLQSIKIPTVHSVGGARRIFRENEVITLDASSGDVLLGAGKLPESEKVVDSSVSEGPIKKFEDVRFEQQEGLQVIKTGTKVWQIFRPSDPHLDLANADGLFVDMNDYYQIAAVNPEYLLSEPEYRRSFIKEVAASLKPVLVELGEKKLILKANDLDYESLVKMKGNEVINFNTKDFAGSGKFVKNPKLLEIELEILSILRNSEALRNIYLALPRVNTAEELIEVKKTVSSYGFRRSSTFKLMAVISEPLGMLSVKSIVENDIDSVIFDLSAILKRLFGGIKYELSHDLITFLTWVCSTVNANKSEAYILNEGLVIEKEVVSKLMSKGVSNFVLPQEDVYQSKMLFSSLEVKKIVAKNKRGRKRKDIDYGF